MNGLGRLTMISRLITMQKIIKQLLTLFDEFEIESGALVEFEM